MAIDPQLEYHLRELKTALDPASPAHALPDFRRAHSAILDIGCGIGQSLIVDDSDAGRLRVGVDVDQQSLAYGHSRFPDICHVVAVAEALPFREGAFDLVMSRIVLPYTDLRASLPEVARVLTAGGRVWISLHSLRMVCRWISRSAKAGAWKDVLFRLYVVANGLAFHFAGAQFRFPVKHLCESFQTRRGIRRALLKLGLIEVQFPQGRHFVCTARKR